MVEVCDEDIIKSVKVEMTQELYVS